MHEVCLGCNQLDCLREADAMCAAYKFLEWFNDLGEDNAATMMEALQEYHEER